MGFDDDRPIWLQLVDDFSRRIAAGEWPPGSKVASVRELAQEFGVNPNTVQRALNQLDDRGLTATERTAGRYVTTDAARVQDHRTREAEDLVDALITAIRALGLDQAETEALLHTRWYDKEKS
ncbi:MAG: GntR family transcriptional regulator [Propionibacteriaceae bacterium]|jgi:DNA-binding transcriptional regulator YhcF (GntR family)|nr:GntR family transcriptional regulator [Propionibacteriaceae bacterium]